MCAYNRVARLLTLPVTLSNRGIAYAGFLRRSITAYKTPHIFRLNHGALDVRYGRCCLGCWSRTTAARRMKGVVRPQQAPTAKKLSTHRQIGGEAGATATGPSGSIGKFDMVVYKADRECLGLSLHVYQMPCSTAALCRRPRPSLGCGKWGWPGIAWAGNDDQGVISHPVEAFPL